jgi:hypothetical protein
MGHSPAGGASAGASFGTLSDSIAGGSSSRSVFGKNVRTGKLLRLVRRQECPFQAFEQYVWPAGLVKPRQAVLFPRHVDEFCVERTVMLSVFLIFVQVRLG